MGRMRQAIAGVTAVLLTVGVTSAAAADEPAPEPTATTGEAPGEEPGTDDAPAPDDGPVDDGTRAGDEVPADDPVAGAAPSDDAAPDAALPDLVRLPLADVPATAGAMDLSNTVRSGPERVLELEVPTASVVGVEWTGEGAPEAQLSARVDGTWGEWVDVTFDDLAEAGSPAGLVSDEVVVGAADAVRVRLHGSPADATLLAVPLTESTADATVAQAQELAHAASAPRVIGRAAWGASEAIPRPDCARPEYGTRLERFVVHHTAGTNSYGSGDVPALLRGIQAYHVSGRGWCDVGYNVLVDKFGQVWEGRRGGLDKLVVGVHASGFNTNTVGVSVLGDYTKVDVPAAVVDALSQVIGWKAYLHGLDPAGASVKNGVLRPHVIGHRDVAQTACPGRIQNFLPQIAQQARAIALSYTPTLGGESRVAGTAGQVTQKATLYLDLPVPSTWDLTIGNPSSPVARMSGQTTAIRRVVSVPWAGELAMGVYAAPGSYPVTVSARTTLGKTYGGSIGTLTLQPSALHTARAVSGVATFAGTASVTETRQLRPSTGMADGQVTALVLAVRPTGSTPATLTFSPGGAPIASPVTYTTSRYAAGATQVVAGTSGSGTVTVTRAAGSGPVTIDLVGVLRANAQGVPFWDVPAPHELGPDIAWLAARGITTGWGDGRFNPDAAVSREAMAAFLYRAAGSPSFMPPARPTFTDVATGHPFHREIEWLAAQGIAEGYADSGGRTFRGGERVTREATAAFLARYADADLGSVGPGRFRDVPSGSAFAAHIAWLASAGVANGYADGTFRPSAPVTRQAIAAFLHRLDAVV